MPLTNPFPIAPLNQPFAPRFFKAGCADAAQLVAGGVAHDQLVLDYRDKCLCKFDNGGWQYLAGGDYAGTVPPPPAVPPSLPLVMDSAHLQKLSAAVWDLEPVAGFHLGPIVFAPYAQLPALLVQHLQQWPFAGGKGVFLIFDVIAASSWAAGAATGLPTAPQVAIPVAASP